MHVHSPFPHHCSSAGVKHDLHAVAAARMELGLVYMETNRLHDAERALEATMLVRTPTA